MNRKWMVLSVVATAAWSQIKSPNELAVWFPDGTGLNIHTESSGGNLPLSTTGSVSTSGKDSHRLVLDKNGQVLFGYDIEARKAGEGTFIIRIKPSREAIRSSCCTDEKRTVAYMLTVAAVRDFPPLRIGDAVQVDILQNPVTGEKIYDVLRVSGDRPPSPNAAKPQPQRFSLQDVRVAIDGKTIVEQHSIWMVGAGMMIHLPGRGQFYLALSPPPDFPLFQASGWVDHGILRFHAGSELVEVTSKTNVLQTDYGTVWVYSVPPSGEAERLREELAEARKVYSARHPNVLALEKRLAAVDRGIEFHCADDVESLIRKK